MPQEASTMHKTVSVTHYEATRHSFCTQLATVEENALKVKDAMRHSSIKMTEKYYHGNVNIIRSTFEKRTATVTPIEQTKEKTPEKK